MSTILNVRENISLILLEFKKKCVEILFVLLTDGMCYFAINVFSGCLNSSLIDPHKNTAINLEFLFI